MKVLITGGGFLGIRLGQALSAAGHVLRYLDIAPAPLPGLDWRLGDVSSPLAVSRALEGCSHVVHLAALLTPACAADPHRGAQVNLIGSLNVFEAARRSGLKHVVYASSAGVYGPDDATRPRPTTLYGTWKLACEGVARAYFADHGAAPRRLPRGGSRRPPARPAPGSRCPRRGVPRCRAAPGPAARARAA